MIKDKPNLIGVTLRDSNEPTNGVHFAFALRAKNANYLFRFSLTLLYKKEKSIEFTANETKQKQKNPKNILLLNFRTVVLQWWRLQTGETIMSWIKELIIY